MHEAANIPPRGNFGHLQVSVLTQPMTQFLSEPIYRFGAGPEKKPDSVE
jgi:hypothetical protein